MLPPSDQPALYAVFILIPLLGGLLSFAACDNTPTALAWRNSLVKSCLSPGSLVTALTWVFLYVSMGHASFSVYMRTDTTMLSTPFIAYLTQLLLNHFYIIVLFGLQRIDLAFLMIIPLWMSTSITTGLFYGVCVEAGRLMLPTCLWVSFNVYLNFVLYTCNPVYTEFEFVCENNNMQKRKEL